VGLGREFRKTALYNNLVGEEVLQTKQNQHNIHVKPPTTRKKRFSHTAGSNDVNKEVNQ